MMDNMCKGSDHHARTRAPKRCSLRPPAGNANCPRELFRSSPMPLSSAISTETPTFCRSCTEPIPCVYPFGRPGNLHCLGTSPIVQSQLETYLVSLPWSVAAIVLMDHNVAVMVDLFEFLGNDPTKRTPVVFHSTMVQLAAHGG